MKDKTIETGIILLIDQEEASVAPHGQEEIKQGY